jgi:predicted CDP-diglyceride synthetase/phosphatidate cytidylyltransferase
MNELYLQLLPILIPLAIILFILVVVALLDLKKQTATRGPKWFWALLISLWWLVGPLAYFALGRKEE